MAMDSRPDSRELKPYDAIEFFKTCVNYLDQMPTGGSIGASYIGERIQIPRGAPTLILVIHFSV
jgi:hypothetical protein